jgi:hypothetical protein
MFSLKNQVEDEALAIGGAATNKAIPVKRSRRLRPNCVDDVFFSTWIKGLKAIAEAANERTRRKKRIVTKTTNVRNYEESGEKS